MTKRCVALRHVAFEDLGLFEPVLRRRGYEIEYVQAGPHALSEQAWLDADLVVVLGGPIGVGDTTTIPGLTTRSRASASAWTSGARCWVCAWVRS